MDISVIDKNLAQTGIEGVELEWISSHDERFSVHGVYYDEKEGLYVRMPVDVAKEANINLGGLAMLTSGGRLRFVTDSPYIAIKASVPARKPMPHMSITGSTGFSVYADGVFQNRVSPVFDDFKNMPANPIDGKVIFAEKKDFIKVGKKQLVEIYFPLYGGVFELYIGVAPGSEVECAPPYKHKKPMLFYGSSITQGACVSRPGNDYISIIARRLDSDYINLGFSGSGNAEDAMLDYITSIDASLYGFDYNLYPNRKDRVLPPHFSIYEKIRKMHPDAAIILYDKPGDLWAEREAIIRSTYEKARELGDENVGFVPAIALWGEKERDACTVDLLHPNDLGAMRMADALYPVIFELLEKNHETEESF